MNNRLYLICKLVIFKSELLLSNGVLEGVECIPRMLAISMAI
jgi:hypothetical protein